jgi:hypothetical protein
MKTFVLRKEKFEISDSSIQDIKIAFEYGKKQGILAGDWIYMVDPETMNEVGNLFKSQKSGVLSTYNFFVKIAKL